MAGERGLNGGADIESVLTSRGLLSGAARSSSPIIPDRR
jgi:hypothetical protein